MRDEYNDYFVERLQGDKRPPRPTLEDLHTLEDLIGENINWRSDALYFFSLNVYLMLLHPLKAVNHRPNLNILLQSDEGELIRQDIELIKSRAEDVSIARERSYVSATSVVIALGEVVEDLQSTSFQIWGPTNNQLSAV